MISSYEEMYQRFHDDPEGLNDEINRDSLVEEHAIMPAMLAQTALTIKWGILAAVAEARVKKQKLHMSKTVWPACCDWATTELQKFPARVTKTLIDDKAVEHPMYLAAKKIMITMETILSIAKRVENTMWAKKDMLQSINSRQGRELDTTRASD